MVTATFRALTTRGAHFHLTCTFYVTYKRIHWLQSTQLAELSMIIVNRIFLKFSVQKHLHLWNSLLEWLFVVGNLVCNGKHDDYRRARF